MLHAIFTGCIGYIISIRTIASTSGDHQKPSFATFLIAFAIGIALHITYNLSMHYVPIIGGIVFVIGGYGVLSYVLYKSDRLYYTS